MNKQFYFLSGLPRSGSTLLTTLLAQNPKIHAEGNSAVCQLMWDTHVSIVSNAAQQLWASGRVHSAESIVRGIPHIYYNDVEKPYVIDKCRSWTLPANMQLIKQYITTKPKVIVLLRPIEQILGSFYNLYVRNNTTPDANFFVDMLAARSEPIMRSFDGVMSTIGANNKDFLYITYDKLVKDTVSTLRLVYDFLDMDYYDHNLTNIINEHPEDDTVYELEYYHEVRPTINVQSYDVDVPRDILDKCKQLNFLLGV